MDTNKSQPRCCEVCGSTHFHLARFAEYDVFSNGGYRLLSNESYEAVVCLCGRARSTRKLLPRNAVDKSFQASQNAAQRRYEQMAPDEVRARLEQAFVTRSEFERLCQQMTSLEMALRQVSQRDGKQT